MSLSADRRKSITVLRDLQGSTASPSLTDYLVAKNEDAAKEIYNQKWLKYRKTLNK
jgi:hypothetical protein